MTVEPNDPTRAGGTLPKKIGTGLTLSLNEIETLCAKATRGAGFSWGLAEDAGRAAGWLTMRGIDGADALLSVLDGSRGVAPIPGKTHWSAPNDAPLCPITTGTALADFGGLPDGLRAGGTLTLGPVLQTVLLLPFLETVAARLGGCVSLACEGSSVRVDGKGHLSGEIVAGTSQVVLRHHDDAVPSDKKRPCAIATGTVQALNLLALETTVPPSAKSRADAGSAAGDND